MKTTTSVAIVLLCLFVARDAAAQWNLARFNASRNRVFATVGLDPAIVTSVGYARVIPVVGHDIQLAGEIGVVTAGIDARDFRARLEMQSSVVLWKSLRLGGSATFITRGTENAIYRGLNFGADFTGTAGVYHPGWFAVTQFGFDKAVVTHITHTDWYRENYFPDAKDGWYLNAGGTFHYGVAGGITLGNAELVGRAGLLRTEKFNDLTPPMYASVGLGFAL